MCSFFFIFILFSSLFLSSKIFFLSSLICSIKIMNSKNIDWSRKLESIVKYKEVSQEGTLRAGNQLMYWLQVELSAFVDIGFNTGFVSFDLLVWTKKSCSTFACLNFNCKHRIRLWVKVKSSWVCSLHHRIMRGIILLTASYEKVSRHSCSTFAILKKHQFISNSVMKKLKFYFFGKKNDWKMPHFFMSNWKKINTIKLREFIQ